MGRYKQPIQTTPQQLSREIVEALKEMPGSSELYDLAVELLNLHAAKNSDYSDQHALSNFIWTAAYAETTPRIALRVLMAKQQAAVLTIEKRGTIFTDSFRQRKMDIIVYAMLELALETALPHLIDEIQTLAPIQSRVSKSYFKDLFTKLRPGQVSELD